MKTWHNIFKRRILDEFNSDEFNCFDYALRNCDALNSSHSHIWSKYTEQILLKISFEFSVWIINDRVSEIYLHRRVWSYTE